VAATPARRLRVRSFLDLHLRQTLERPSKIAAAESKSLAKPSRRISRRLPLPLGAAAYVFGLGKRAASSRSFWSASSASSTVNDHRPSALRFPTR